MQCSESQCCFSVKLTWFVFMSLCNVCRAESQYYPEPLFLSGAPCLVAISDTEYEWGNLKAGMCHGVRGDSLFFPIRHYDIQKQILWTHHPVEDRWPTAQCIRYRGHFDQLPETDLSDCLCAVQQKDGFFAVGIEQKTDDTQSCMTKNLSYSDYFIAERHSSSILPEQESENILGHILLAGFGVLSVIATVKVLYDVNLANYGIGLVYFLYIIIAYREFPIKRKCQ